MSAPSPGARSSMSGSALLPIAIPSGVGLGGTFSVVLPEPLGAKDLVVPTWHNFSEGQLLYYDKGRGTFVPPDKIQTWMPLALEGAEEEYSNPLASVAFENEPELAIVAEPKGFFARAGDFLRDATTTHPVGSEQGTGEQQEATSCDLAKEKIKQLEKILIETQEQYKIQEKDLADARARDHKLYKSGALKPGEQSSETEAASQELLDIRKKVEDLEETVTDLKEKRRARNRCLKGLLAELDELTEQHGKYLADIKKNHALAEANNVKKLKRAGRDTGLAFEASDGEALQEMFGRADDDDEAAAATRPRSDSISSAPGGGEPPLESNNFSQSGGNPDFPVGYSKEISDYFVTSFGEVGDRSKISGRDDERGRPPLTPHEEMLWYNMNAEFDKKGLQGTKVGGICTQWDGGMASGDQWPDLEPVKMGTPRNCFSFATPNSQTGVYSYNFIYPAGRKHTIVTTSHIGLLQRRGVPVIAANEAGTKTMIDIDWPSSGDPPEIEKMNVSFEPTDETPKEGEEWQVLTPSWEKHYMHPDIDRKAHQDSQMPDPMGGVVDYEDGVQPDPEMLDGLYSENETI